MTLRTETIPSPTERAAGAHPHEARRRGLRARALASTRFLARCAALLLVLLVAGGGAPSAQTLFVAQIRAATAGWGFDLLGWEAAALLEKGQAAIRSPIKGLDDAAQSQAVIDYLDRARTISRLEDELVTRAASADTDLRGAKPADAGDGAQGGLAVESAAAREDAAIAAEIADLRMVQAVQRPIAEAAIAHQVAAVLQELGVGVGGVVMPPVTFTFTESPMKLVVSPRSRIITRDAMILNPAMPLAEIEDAEAALGSAGDDLSAYVTPTGGMGAFPTMVIEEASLPWILSTVAHEWVHTYLAFFPLGFNYGVDQENTTINETVADLVGDEVGLLVLQRYYPALAMPSPAAGSPAAESAPRTFDFRKEMAETRAAVDKLLRVGRIADAEHYMDVRRLLFVENGYHIRKLNQAYFAFHGSYGTSGAADVSTPDALGPRVARLRALTGDAVTFLRTVRGITDRAGLERLIAERE